MKVFRYIKPTKRHSFGGPGINHYLKINAPSKINGISSHAASKKSDEKLAKPEVADYLLIVKPCKTYKCT